MKTDVLKAIEEVKKCADAETVVELSVEQYEIYKGNCFFSK